MKICIPSWKSPEALNLLFLTICLTGFPLSTLEKLIWKARSFLTVGLAQIAGAIAQSIVGRKWKKFAQLLYWYFFFAIPLSASNRHVFFSSKFSQWKWFGLLCKHPIARISKSSNESREWRLHKRIKFLSSKFEFRKNNKYVHKCRFM